MKALSEKYFNLRFIITCDFGILLNVIVFTFEKKPEILQILIKMAQLKAIMKKKNPQENHEASKYFKRFQEIYSEGTLEPKIVILNLRIEN